MTILRSSFLFLAIGALLGAPGCTLATASDEEAVEGMDQTNGDAPPIDEETVAGTLGPGDPNGIITGNGAHPLTPELLNLWAPVARKLTLGALTTASLELSDLLGIPGGRTFIDYAVKCALPAGQSLTANYFGVKHAFKGHVGLAPEWANGPLSESGRRWLSACLLAHVNATATPVTLLIRGEHPALKVPSGASTGTFVLREGAFYGDIFGLTPTKYACVGAASIPERMCTESVAGISPCGFVVPGHCRAATSACEDLSNGAYDTCHSKVIQPTDDTSTAYPETITVYLQP